MERSSKVQKEGIPELVAKVDSGQISVSSASEIAENPTEEQKRLLSLPKQERSKKIKKKSSARAKTPKEQKSEEQTGSSDEIIKRGNPPERGDLIREFEAGAVSKETPPDLR